MNKNDYRRALLMLRSLKTGVSGYVRLERRTLMGTLQFTVNGVSGSSDLYAILLYRKNGGWSAVRLAEFGAPRYGQIGLVWKFDPRNIEGRTLEQYDLAAVIEIKNDVCDLLLCGNLNGSVEADWVQIRDAACRLFSPVRISGAPIAPIDEAAGEDGLQTLPEYSEQSQAYPGASSECSCLETAAESSVSESDASAFGDASAQSAEPEMTDSSLSPENDAVTRENPSSPSETANDESVLNQTASRRNLTDQPADQSAELFPLDSSAESAIESDAPFAITEAPIDLDELDTIAEDPVEPDELDTPAESPIEADEFDTPAEDAVEPDELDSPAEDLHRTQSAGEQLELDDPGAEWPTAVEPLRRLFFSSEAIIPFEMQGYVFIRTPLSEESGISSCLCGIRCEGGIPSSVCYAIPSQYTAEPPAGLEGYIWRGDHLRGYWTICERLSPDNPNSQ